MSWIAEYQIILNTGVLASPNHPGNYPHNLNKTETIRVETGRILRLEFTYFAVYVGGSISTCTSDFVKITDGNGTNLMNKSCGYSNIPQNHAWYFHPPDLTSFTNTVHVSFLTGSSNPSAIGWSLRWTAVTSGKKSKS